MRVVLSPYHLTTREPPAMAALLLAEAVVTLVPAPGREFGRAEFQAAARRSERYARFIDSWAWSLPLWTAGVLSSACDGADPGSDVREAFRVIESDAALDALRPLLKPSVFEEDASYLDALAGDLLKGGPDPALSIPIAAGLDRFATRRGLAVVRGSASSIAQRAEARLARNGFSFAAPVLLQASGEHVLRARQILEPELRSLRAAVQAALESAKAGETSGRVATDRVQRAAGEYAAAFDRTRERICACERDEARVLDGIVTVTAEILPVDAALRASVAAVRALGGGPARATGRGATATLPVVRDPLAGERFASLVVKAVGRPDARGVR